MSTSSICRRPAAYAAIFFILLTNQALFAQNTNYFPLTGNVGIGNTLPGSLLDVGSATIPSYVPANSSISGLQVRTYMGQPNFSANSSFYNELGVANNGSQETMQIYSVSSQPSGTTSLVMPLFVFQNYTGGGTLGQVREIFSDGAMSGSGTVTNWYQFEGNANNSGTGAITNGYGFYMNPWGGTVTNKYGVYINDATATNYFGGLVGIGTVNTFGELRAAKR